MDALTLGIGVMYLALAATTWARGRRVGAGVLLRLVPFQLVVGTMGSIVVLEDLGLVRLVPVVFLLTLALYPVTLLRFVAALVPSSTRLASAWIWLAVAACELAAITAWVADTDLVLVTAMLLLALAAVGAHVTAFVVVRRQAVSLRSAFVRRRAHALNSGLCLLGLAFALALFLPALGWVTHVLGLVSAVVLIAFTVPPSWLQAVFMQPDLDALADAEQALATDDDATAATVAILEALRSLVAARYVWLDRTDLPRLGAGDPPAGAAPAPAPALDLDRWGVSTTAMDRDGPGAGTWVVRLRTDDGILGVILDTDPATFGIDRGQLLPRLARRITFAIDARHLVAARAARDHAAQEAAHFRDLAELRDDLLATMNHELRTPLVTVAGGLELVCARWDDLGDAQRRLLVERALSNSQDLQLVLFDVLALAALRAGSATARPGPIQVARLLELAVEPLPRDERLALHVDDAMVTLDVGHAARLLRHLIGNGLAHTDGSVLVEAGVHDDALRVVVTDQGQGLPHELFETFSRGGHHLTRAARGLGLGLSLVQESAQLLGADVVVDSLTVDGTRAVCTFPLPPGAVDAPATGTTRMPAAAHR